MRGFVAGVSSRGSAGQRARRYPDSVEHLETPLRHRFPDAIELSVADRTGTGDHFHVVVAGPRLDRLPVVDQHRFLYDALAEPLADRTIHKLRITTKRSG
jgi:stress-induced morphogen